MGITRWTRSVIKRQVTRIRSFSTRSHTYHKIPGQLSPTAFKHAELDCLQSVTCRWATVRRTAGAGAGNTTAAGRVMCPHSRPPAHDHLLTPFAPHGGHSRGTSAPPCQGTTESHSLARFSTAAASAPTRSARPWTEPTSSPWSPHARVGQS